MTSWNLRKPKGWESYKKISNDVAESIEEIIGENELDIDVVVKRVDKLQDKVKFAAFGKTKVKQGKQVVPNDDLINESKGKETAKNLLKKQSDRIEKEINEIKETKGRRCSKVFKMKDLVAGPKKMEQEAHAI